MTNYLSSISTQFSPSTSSNLTSTISSREVGTFSNKIRSYGQFPMAPVYESPIVFSLPSKSAKASRAALTVLPVYITSSTKTRFISVILKGISVLCTTGDGASLTNRHDKELYQNTHRNLFALNGINVVS